jgi:hypothetical protein
MGRRVPAFSLRPMDSPARYSGVGTRMRLAGSILTRAFCAIFPPDRALFIFPSDGKRFCLM